MLDSHTLVSADEPMTQLDDDALAAIVGGLGPVSKIVGEIVTFLWGCVKTGLDDVIDAAEEGYGDARAS